MATADGEEGTGWEGRTELRRTDTCPTGIEEDNHVPTVDEVVVVSGKTILGVAQSMSGFVIWSQLIPKITSMFFMRGQIVRSTLQFFEDTVNNVCGHCPWESSLRPSASSKSVS